MISKGTIKLAVTVREHPKVSTMMTKFLAVNCPLAFNEVIGRPLLKALKVVTSIYYLTIIFPTTEETRQMRGRQYDLRECYNKSLELVEKEIKLPQMIEV